MSIVEWDDLAGNPYKWHQNIIAWVNANGGEAGFIPEGSGMVSWVNAGGEGDSPPRIAVRTINGWAYAEPGDLITFDEDDEEWFEVQTASGTERHRAFYVVPKEDKGVTST